MKALTIQQPFAELIAAGNKCVENRSWPASYRGPLLIHAGKSRVRCGNAQLDAVSDATGVPLTVDSLTFGAIVARCELVATFGIRDIRAGIADERFPWLRHDIHAEGPWCWVLENVRRIGPVPCSGARGLWDYVGEVPEGEGSAGD